MADGPAAGELFRALGAVVETPGRELERVAEALGLGPPPEPADHADLFGFQLFPYASVYLGPEGALGGAARDRMAGFWRALGATPVAEPDHLPLLLASHAGLVDRSGDDRRWLHARRAFFWEFLASWLPVYADRAVELSARFYRGWALLLLDALREEADALGPEPPHPPAAFRDLPALGDPRSAGADAFLEGLLAPAVSGWIVVRDDLATAARELGLGYRVGERRWVLRALMGQAPEAVLAWLARHAAARGDRYEELFPADGPIAAHWRERARATAGLLSELAREASTDLYDPPERTPE